MICLKAKRLVRRVAGARSNVSVEVLQESSQSPQCSGEEWHYETMGGTWIYHPSAYAKRGWSNMRYVSSSIRVEVGEGWLAANKDLIDRSKNWALAADAAETYFAEQEYRDNLAEFLTPIAKLEVLNV